MKHLGAYSQHFIFFVTYELAQQARMLHNIRLQKLSNDKQSNLLVLFISCKEYEVLLGAVFTTLHFLRNL